MIGHLGSEAMISHLGSEAMISHLGDGLGKRLRSATW